MSDREIIVRVPEELAERARSVGLSLDAQSEQMLAVLEAQIRKREAARRLDEIAGELQSLPPELKPTPEEIQAEIRAYWAEKTGSSNTSE